MRSVDNVGVPLIVIANKQVSIFLKISTPKKYQSHLFMIFLSLDTSKNFFGTEIHNLGDT